MEDKKQKIDDLVSKLDSMIQGGGTHISSDVLVKKAEEKAVCTFTSDANDCPTCANIPNISDIDGGEN